ncbi:unnamed protein product [Kuraishia capsulata CBS 1993]|uniref:WH1 domain-containing protein n=1 Tax=Kuraishia capsulata CBS 1993 TaxID=1382522 RepID=W6MH02_9ASCO|nr:uncharacterized protein KUCA_T00001163001 [Kuraishia capsulata CBS 1993]CDK25196.1 unnamed protein product [Kuraishia capsulata CBS 1993]
MVVLTSADKEKIKRAIPKNANKIIAAGVARLYIAHPDPQAWQFTGLSGAIVFVDDLVGHTFFLKLVDIIGHRGVIWDQELYVGFQYNQDRSFFHSFELEECFGGLLFEETGEASQFYKKVTSKEKHGSKQTIQNKNAIALKKKPDAPRAAGPRGDMGDPINAQRVRRTRGPIYYDDVPPPEWRSFYAELESMGISEDMIADNRDFIKNYINEQGGPLVGLEPPIPRKFQYKTASNDTPSQSRIASGSSIKKKKAPPPPPPGVPAAPHAVPAPSMHSSDNDSGYDFNPPDFEPVTSSSTTPHHSSAETTRGSTPAPIASTPAPEPAPAVAPTPAGPVHKVPPAMPFLGQNAHPPAPVGQPQQPHYQQSSPFGANGNAPPPPARNGVPTQYGQRPPVHNVPPPPPSRNPGPSVPPRGGAPPPLPPKAPSRAPGPALPGRGPVPTPYGQPSAPQQTQGRTPPAPPPPRRGNGPPPPPSRATARPTAPPQLPTSPRPMSPPQNVYPAQQQTQYQPQQTQSPYQQQSPYQPQQQQPQSPYQPQQQQPQSPYQPQQSAYQPPQNPYQPQSPYQPQQSIPQAPPMPQSPTPVAPPLPTAHNTIPVAPPPPPMTQSAIPVAPPPPPMASGGPPPPPMGGFSQESPAPALPQVDGGRDALLASIRSSGLGSLKKVDKSQLDKPSVLLQEAKGEPVAQPSGNGGAPGQPASLADALAAALSSRKSKVALSDDDDDGDW